MRGTAEESAVPRIVDRRVARAAPAVRAIGRHAYTYIVDNRVLVSKRIQRMRQARRGGCGSPRSSPSCATAAFASSASSRSRPTRASSAGPRPTTAHLGVAGDGDPVMGRRLIGEDPCRIELVERADLVRRPAGRPRADEGARGDRLALWDIKAQVARRARVPAASAGSSVTGSRCTGRTSPRTARCGRRSWAPSRRPRTRIGRPVRATSSPRASRSSRRTSMQEPRDGGKPCFPRTSTAPSTGGRSMRRCDWIGTLRDVVGPSIGIAVDVQFDYRMGGIVQLARALEPFGLYWLEVEVVRPGRVARRASADADAPLSRRVAHPARGVPAVLPAPRDGRRDDRDAGQRPVRDAPDRRDGRAVRHDGLAPRLDEPAVHDDQRPAVRGAAERRDPRDRPRRRALEDGPADPAVRDRERRAGRARPARLGRRHQRGVGASAAAQMPALPAADGTWR